MFLTDTHCHLNFNTFDFDREEVILAARQAGVNRILNPGIDIETSRQAIDLADRYPEVYAAVGVHPNDASGWTDSCLSELRQMASHPKVVAIGEIGLDYYRDRAPRDVQQRVLRMQLNLARELELPVIIHNRQAGEDLFGILTTWQDEMAQENNALAKRPGVMHSFSEDPDYARAIMDHHFFIGITGPVTFKNGTLLQQVVARAPLDHVLIETDAPFLTPHPFRGKRNEPGFVRFVLEKIAAIHDIPVDDAAEKITENARQLFQW